MTINQEMESARNIYGAFHSTHEIYAVLQEEVEEFWELVREKPNKEKSQGMIKELTQIVAIAQRAINELQNDEIKFV